MFWSLKFANRYCSIHQYVDKWIDSILTLLFTLIQSICHSPECPNLSDMSIFYYFITYIWGETTVPSIKNCTILFNVSHLFRRCQSIQWNSFRFNKLIIQDGLYITWFSYCSYSTTQTFLFSMTRYQKHRIIALNQCERCVRTPINESITWINVCLILVENTIPVWCTR